MIDPVWEEIYSAGHETRYPMDSVVSFVHNYAPKITERHLVKVVEIGFGCGNNLWFAANEGFSVSGMEGSESAVRAAEKRFNLEGLSADLRQGDFVSLPFEGNTFDLAIDRAALTHVGMSECKKAINEVCRVLKHGGYFHFNAYADRHSSNHFSSVGMDGLRQKISGGTLVGVGQVLFVSRGDIDSLFSNQWKLLQLQRREWTDLLNETGDIHAEWLVVAEKI